MIETADIVGTGLKITVPKDELVQALSVVSRAVSNRTSVQILSGILLEASGGAGGGTGELRVAATDMELSLRATIAAQIDGDGSIVLPGKTLVDIARLLPSDEVTIEHRPSESVVHVTAGSASYTLHTYNPEDFPRLPDVTSVQTFPVDRESLLETILRVARAASRDESRPVLTGILVQFAGGTLTMAATDSYRLAVKETELSGKAPDLEAIVPGRALTELARVATAGDSIDVGVHENQVVFGTGSDSGGSGSGGGIWLTTRRIDGQFPNYRQLLPEQFEHELTLPRTELLEVVRRASVMIQRATPLQLRFAEGEITVIARTHEVGESQESMPAPYSGETLEIGFNADFLREGLESVDGDDIRFKLISPLRPAVLQGDGDEFTYLVMPIRLPG
jgi:DNA polymerase III subunit beta